MAELDSATAAGFSDQNGVYGYVSVRSNTSTARAVVIPAGTTEVALAGYFVASRGDLGPFIDSLPTADPRLAYQTMTSVIAASRTGALDDPAEEAAAVELAVLLAYGADPTLTERPWVNERARQLLATAKEDPAPEPRDVVLSISGNAGRDDVRLWVLPLERYLQGIDGYRTSVTVNYAGNSFDFEVEGPSCLVLPRLTQDQPVSLIVVHHEELPAGTVLAASENGNFGGGLLLVDSLSLDYEFVITAGGEQS